MTLAIGVRSLTARRTRGASTGTRRSTCSRLTRARRYAPQRVSAHRASPPARPETRSQARSALTARNPYWHVLSLRAEFDPPLDVGALKPSCASAHRGREKTSTQDGGPRRHNHFPSDRALQRSPTRNAGLHSRQRDIRSPRVRGRNREQGKYLFCGFAACPHPGVCARSKPTESDTQHRIGQQIPGHVGRERRKWRIDVRTAQRPSERFAEKQGRQQRSQRYRWENCRQNGNRDDERHCQRGTSVYQSGAAPAEAHDLVPMAAPPVRVLVRELVQQQQIERHEKRRNGCRERCQSRRTALHPRKPEHGEKAQPESSEDLA